ncbi:TerC family protein [Christiangramia forsetii]|uniref:TerC family membrane protein n=2 Tax=Christiangramia forsetii TaxID=411153 RepID=A0M0E5_CHRFK|nr:TerC family protein [Christiangramia forsetii]GGG41095.1 membrane protein [Christiangramia forsetii]CAL66090.1 TerC family membrane protein [Christiangramia forsetii KT0803]
MQNFLLSFLFIQANPASASPEIDTWIWIAFAAFIVLLLIVDLKLVMRNPHKINTREAAWYSAGWISLGVAFTGVIAWWQGTGAAGEYITGYLIEKSLSMDNVFLWAVLFTYFKVPKEFQHKVLFWGIFGALVLRVAFILGGIALIEKFHWIIYVFGAFLLFTAYKIFKSKTSGTDPENNRIFKWAKKIIPQTNKYVEDKFFVIENGKRLATPLFVVLVIVELTDIIFALDSIPAILAVTRDKFIVISSNAFAILGLRALYFLLADMKDRFVFLNEGLAIILAFVGVKFLVSEQVEIPIWISLVFIAVILTGSILLSLRHKPKS